MKACAIDVHHHYVPESLLEEAKKRGQHLGVTLTEKDGNRSLSFAGGPPFVLHPELPAIEERLKMMAGLQARHGRAGSAHRDARLPAHRRARRELVQRLQRRHRRAGQAISRPLRRHGVGAAARSGARREGAGARRARSEFSRRLHRHQRQRQLLWYRGVRSVLGQSPGARRHGRHASRRRRRRRQDESLRFETHLRQPRRQRALLRLHDLQRRVRPLSQFKTLHPPRRRLLPLSSRPLRPGMGSPRRRPRRKGQDGAELVS